MKSDNRFFGGTMIMVGTIVGSGMFALPTICANAGFTYASILLIIAWFLSTLTGLMIIEVNLAFPENSCSFSTMAEGTLGSFGKVVTWISYLFMLYAITTSYIIGEVSIVTATLESIGIKIPGWISALSFTIIMGGAVFWSTKAVDLVNRGLMSVKGILLLATIFLMMPHIDVAKLLANQNIEQIKYLGAAAPIFLSAFCYQFIIPSLRVYIGPKPNELKKMVFFGTTFALIIYLLWLAVTLGIVPLTGSNSFTTWVQYNYGSVGEFTQIVIRTVNNELVTNSLNFFTNIAMTTSFLGVALGLFDFLADGFKRSDTRFGRLQTSGLTFIPPLLFGIFYPNGFEKALTIAAIFLAILIVVLPALMLYKLRKNKNLKSTYRMFGGNLMIITVVAIGVVFFILSIMESLNLLPTTLDLISIK